MKSSELTCLFAAIRDRRKGKHEPTMWNGARRQVRAARCGTARMGKSEMNAAERMKAMELRTAGHTYTEIARFLRRPESTVWTSIRKHDPLNEAHRKGLSKHRTGRKKVLTEIQKRDIATYVKLNSNFKMKILLQEMDLSDKQRSTVQRFVREVKEKLYDEEYYQLRMEQLHRSSSGAMTATPPEAELMEYADDNQSPLGPDQYTLGNNNGNDTTAQHQNSNASTERLAGDGRQGDEQGDGDA
ncbi:MAG: hypothetical protein M1828_003079 [Chrysothrix sp. TS-e1954]|nr:MAG: hypothetical protein M1828_003079 [Chrysothrix sp. TS-e1954]